MLSLLLSVALVVLGNDGVVRVSDPSGSVASARVHFDLPVGREWKTVARVGAGLSAHSEWAPVGDSVTVPWYALLSDGTRTFGFGVKVQPKAMCCWRVVPGEEHLVEGDFAIILQTGDAVHGELVTDRHPVLLAAGSDYCVCHNFVNFGVAPAHAGWHIIDKPRLLARKISSKNEKNRKNF